MSPLSIARLCAVLGVMMATTVALLLLPQLCWLGEGALIWRGGMVIGGAFFALGIYVWTGERLAVISHPTMDLQRRRAAHDYPFQLARLCFLAAVFAGGGTIVVLWIYVGDRTGALVAGVITYLLLVLPVLGLYLVTRRALRATAAGPPGAGPAPGVRQPVGLRLAFAVQSAGRRVSYGMSCHMLAWH